MKIISVGPDKMTNRLNKFENFDSERVKKKNHIERTIVKCSQS